MNVFLTGATGYIGEALVRALHRAGHGAVGLARSRAKAEARGLPARFVEGDMRAPDRWRDEAARADAAVHLGMEMGPAAAEVDRTALEALLLAGRGRPVVFTSGVWVLGSTGDRAADETAETAPAALVAWRPAHERRALEGGAAVVRPGIVFGGRGGIMASLFESADREGAVTYVGDGENRWTFVHREDLADLYVRLLEAWAAVPAGERLFHAVGGAGERMVEVARAASAAAGRGGDARAWALAEAREKLGAYADALALDQVVLAPRAERLLGWRPRWRGFVRNAAEAYAEWAEAAG
jgi:nucleoside-diphosphate-sugar epimerase